MKHNEFIAAATEIRILLRMLTKLSHQEFQDHLDACGVGLSTSHFGVMRLLKHHPYTIKELSRHMLVEPASLVPIIDELERKTFVRRTADPNDRRRTPLVLTEHGEHLLLTMPVLPATSPFMETLEGMGEDRVTQLLSMLRELAYGMSSNKDTIANLAESVLIQVSERAEHLEKKGKRKETE